MGKLLTAARRMARRGVQLAAIVSAMGVGTAAAWGSGMPPMGVMGARGLMLGSMGRGAAVAAVMAPEAEGSREGLMSLGQPYMLRLHHTHTGEDISIVYRIGNTYLPEAMDRLNYFLRDHRTQDVANYDPTEFDLLHTLMARLHRPNGIIDIVCGYRTPESNEYLRTRASVTGVAEHSQHMLSKAIDIQVPGVATATIRNAALEIGAGGVGYYPSSHFVHVDVGPVREWQFGGRSLRAGRGYRVAGRSGQTRRRGRVVHRRG